ncbi:TIM barrel protein [Clostridium sp. C8]|jgi:fructoselysine 3-epimerase|uniref:sugar phosphate isomerase/epimerase family protein n=1 Tax=Clostridium sp. C8 TaxID=1667357 RepID=UPI00062E7E46|nr:TIM barrel protein [Clostridium sp. C8]KLE14519.1 xylose isomerase [Clostridium sp. C8]
MSKITMDKVSVMSVQYCHYSFSYFLDSMEKCKIRNIDFWGGSPHYCRLHYSTSIEALSKIKEIKKEIDDKGMKVVIYTPETLAYPFSLSSSEKAICNQTIDYFDKAFEDALALGTNRVFINTGCGLLDTPREDSWKRAVENIKIISNRAKKQGITMIIEQLQPYESNLLTTCNDMSRMLKEVNIDNLKACIDLVAMEVVEDNLEQFYSTLNSESIQWIHYADGNPSGHYILGDGNLPLKEYITTLEKYDYNSYIDLEINDSIYWQDPHTSLKRSADYLRSFLPEN